MRRVVRRPLLFAVLLGFWLILSDQYNVLFITMGMVSAFGVTALTDRLVMDVLGPSTQKVRLPVRVWRFAGFVVWLLGKVLVAGVQLAYVVLHPRLPVDPGSLQIRTALVTPLARTTFANCITLVPGTLAVQKEDNVLTVHAFFASAATDIIDGSLQARVAWVFGQDIGAPPSGTWVILPEEVGE